MSRPNRKLERESTGMVTLVRDEKSPKRLAPSNAQVTYYSSVILAILLMGTLSYLSLHMTHRGDVSLASFAQLDTVFKTQGISKFLEEKEALRRKVYKELRENRSEDVLEEAANIAIYLFPDALPNEVLERDIGMAEWAPLQKEIETRPGSREARKSFEDMRANIWNYEAPSREFPQVSDTAKQVLKIYEVMSSP